MKSIGDGRDTYVWMDKWILDNHPRAPYRMQSVFQVNLRVLDLREAGQNQWDRGKVQDLFPSDDAKLILSMPVKEGHRDPYIWPYTNSGSYSVKSGYWLLQTLPSMYEPRNADKVKQNELKAKVWQVKTVPKIKKFLWRMLFGALAVSERLASRGCSRDAMCLRCGAQSETICHTLFVCPVAREDMEKNWEHLLVIMQDTTIPDSIRFVIPWLLWGIWKHRNTLIFQGKHGLYVNWSRMSGGAWLARNAHGQVMYHARTALPASESRFVADLQCLLWALEALVILQIPKVEVALDSALVVEALNNPAVWPRFSLMLGSIHEILSKFASWRAYTIDAAENSVARAIAKSVTKDGHFQSYLSLGGPSRLHEQVKIEAV
ncbi:PREDICTED: uncharacterized protein LOC109125949 [Camelina sativa]|uniref:Uncharacterized protein LOC109125949 n=1 Tax=Camelina sativa TaxID=90675 RepID=A0ABM1QC22_CAMSA|nr:PREDICTED: uncharacterized protein LOC109125949 [Camelina sativa]